MRGPTHTIAELIETDARQQVEATVLAQVVSLVSRGAASTVRIDDGTGLLVVQCPAETGLLGPPLRDWFEFDVVVAPGPRVVPVDPDTVGNDEPDLDRRSEQKFIAQYAQPAGAIATAVRRAQGPKGSV